MTPPLSIPMMETADPVKPGARRARRPPRDAVLAKYMVGRRANILVIDDSRAIRAQLRLLLQACGFTVFEAGHGGEALDILAQEDIATIICDWNMPEMDGIQFCRALRNQHGFEQHYVIMLTANDSRDAIYELFDAGGDDYLTKPVDRIALTARLKGGLRISASRDDLRRTNNELRSSKRALDEAYAKIREDLIVAEMVQKRYLPALDKDLGAIAFAGKFEPAFHTSGDIFNYCRISKDEYCLFAVDVSGHGVASALLAVSVCEALTVNGTPQRLITQKSDGGRVGRDPAAVVADLNTRFASGETDHYFTIIYALVDVAAGRLRFCQAGHPPLIHIGASGKARLVGDGGPPVGMLPDVTFETHEIPLSSGDRLYLYSDGLSEAENPHEEQFGDARMVMTLAGEAPAPLAQSISTLVESARAWRAKDRFEDDVSILGVEIRP